MITIQIWVVTLEFTFKAVCATSDTSLAAAKVDSWLLMRLFWLKKFFGETHSTLHSHGCKRFSTALSCNQCSSSLNSEDVPLSNVLLEEICMYDILYFSYNIYVLRQFHFQKTLLWQLPLKYLTEAQTRHQKPWSLFTISYHHTQQSASGMWNNKIENVSNKIIHQSVRLSRSLQTNSDFDPMSLQLAWSMMLQLQCVLRHMLIQQNTVTVGDVASWTAH